MPKGLKLLLVILLSGLLLSACKPGFPADKFVRQELDGTNTTLIFMNSGRWEGYQGGNLVTWGNYRTEADKITFESDFQCEDVGAQVQVTYYWSYVNDELTFRLVDNDGCGPRLQMLTGEPYVKSQ